MARLFGSIKNINKVAAYKDGKRASLRQLAWLWTVALEFTDPLVLAAWRAAAFHPSVNWSKGAGVHWSLTQAQKIQVQAKLLVRV